MVQWWGWGGRGKSCSVYLRLSCPHPHAGIQRAACVDVHIYCGSRMSHEVETSATWDARSSPCFVGKLPPVPLPHTDPSRRGARWRCVTGPCTGTAPEHPCRWPGIRFYRKPSTETVALPETCEMVRACACVRVRACVRACVCVCVCVCVICTLRGGSLCSDGQDTPFGSGLLRPLWNVGPPPSAESEPLWLAG